MEYIFHKGEFPIEDKFDRVHALLVTEDGRVLMRYKNGEARVTGGRLEQDDDDIETALEREVREEINCEIDRNDYVGYIEAINEDTHERELWARMVARVSQIGEPMPDPDRDNNWIYGRILAPIEIAEREMMNTFPTNKEFLQEALKVARKQEYWTSLPSQEYEVLNVESHD